MLDSTEVVLLIAYPKWKVEKYSAASFPRQRYQGLSSEDSQEIQVGVNGARNCCRVGDEVDVDLHIDINNFAPNEYRGVVNSSVLVVYKGSTQEIIVATESKD